MGHIDKLIAESPYRVVLTDFINKNVVGRWLPHNQYFHYSIIEIRPFMNKHLTLATLLHEIGHSKCHENKCDCVNIHSAKGELHAYIYTLQWLLDNDCKKTLKIEMKHIFDLKKRSDYYGIAVRQLIKTPLWKKCKKHIKNHFWRRLF